MLDLTAGKGVRKELVDVASDWIRSSLVNSGHFKVLDRAYMQMVLQEQEFSMSDCSDAECVVEVGRMLSAETLVAGRISKLGSLYTVNAQIIDVTTGEVIRSAARPCTRCADDVLLSVVACVAMQLVGGR